MTNDKLEILTIDQRTVVKYGNRAAQIIANGGNQSDLMVLFMVNTRHSINEGQVVSSPRRHYSTLKGAIKAATKFVTA